MKSIIKRTKAIAIICASLSVGACSLIPEPISGIDESNLVSFDSVSHKDYQANGIARWGGEIVSVSNLQDYSEIEMLHLPTNSFGKPVSNRNSTGRFKVKVQGFVDPLVFEKGRLVTFLGELRASEMGIIGEQNYKYPVLAAEGFHMWKDEDTFNVQTFHFAPFALRWGSPHFHNYRWGHYGFGHHGFRHHYAANRVTLLRKQAKSDRFVGPRQVRSTRSSESRPVNVVRNIKRDAPRRPVPSPRPVTNGAVTQDR